MKSRSGDPGPPIKGDNLKYTDSSDDDDVHMESSNSDFDCLRRLAFLSVMDNDNGGERGSDVVVKVPERRNVGFSRKRGRIQEDVVGGSNQEDLEVPELVIDDHFQRNIRFKRKKRYMRVKDKQILKWEVWEEKDEKWVEWNMMLDTDLDNQNDAVAEIAEPPSDFIIPLLKYQKEFLAWALKQEESDAKGGILADEMGMGKTAQAIALVLAKRELDQAACEPNGGLLSPSSSAGLPKIKATLVICPVGAMIQWNNEIDRFTSEGSNKVQVYHGANRGKTLHEISEYDFVITTYSTVLAEYRKKGSSLKKECQRCGKFFDEHKIINHVRYYCQSHAKRTSTQKPKQKTSNKGKASESEADIFALHSVKWNRIILDEAHYIKDRHSDTTKAVLALESSYRWALSGTPLQNRVGELYSLIRFLQITPFSYYFCKECDCRRLDHSYNCPNCPHRSVKHFCWWNLFVTSPIAKGNSEEIRKTMILLKHKFLKRILLRRTKKRRVTDLALPPKLVVLRRESLDFEEEDYYNSLYNASRAQFDTYVVDGTLTKNYAHLFGLLMRLRQAVNHPYLVEYSKSGTGKTSSMVNDSSGDQECGLCHDSVEDPVVTSCGHVYCKPCLRDICGSVEQDSCPSCSKPFTVDVNINKNYEDQNTRATVKGFKRSSILNQMQLDNFKSSTKIDALREEIRFMIERDGSAKGIVFSQFTAFLDLISYSLQKSGVNCVQLDGSMHIVERDAAIRRFTEDPDCKIFLLSLKAGGVALNLTVASNVFLMDPWWNPAVERQAQDRIHRIGQYKPVRIVRFIMEDTIEERILKLQERKELLFEGAVSGSSDALGKLTADDLRYLFAN